ncbi:MAG: hypothetical protein QM757_22100 [Paludibaculum sp.]
MKRTHQNQDQAGDSGLAEGAQAVGLSPEVVEPEAAHCEGIENGDLMVAGEEADAEKGAGEGGVGGWVTAAQAAEIEEEGERGPDGSAEHLGPADGAEDTAERVAGSGEEGGGAGAAEVAAEEVAEEGSEVVGEQEVEVDPEWLDVAVVERGEEEGPVERVGGTGLHLADERLAAPEVRVPEREFAGVPGGGLELVPGQDLEGEVGAVEPVVLFGQQLPEDAGGEGQQDEWGEPAGVPGCDGRWVFRHWVMIAD